MSCFRAKVKENQRKPYGIRFLGRDGGVLMCVSHARWMVLLKGDVVRIECKETICSSTPACASAIDCCD